MSGPRDPGDDEVAAGAPVVGDAPADEDDAPWDPDAIVAVPITDALDLHGFRPREVADLVAAYLDAARAAGFTRVRLIHGKGTGALRRTVHAVLARHAAVAGFGLATDAGTWGATIVELRPD